MLRSRGVRRLLGAEASRICGQRRWGTKRTVLRGGTDSHNPWKVLGVSRTADEGELKKAYIKLAKKHHPDVNGGDSTMFKKVKEAYDLIKSGEAEKFYPQTPKPGARAKAGPGQPNWGTGYGGYAGQEQNINYTYSSSSTTFDGRGGQETTYTYRDDKGNSYSYTESKPGGADHFWQAFQAAQTEALRQETERMRQRAAHNSQFQKVFDNWSTHKANDSADYQDYVRSRDQAFYRFLVVWFWLFLFLRLMINMFV